MQIWARAAAQHGAISYAQLTASGINDSNIADWVSAGRLIRVQPRVYGIAGSRDTYERKLWAALLAGGPDAAVSHRAAAGLWCLLEGEQPVEIVVPRGCTPDLRGVIVHQTRDPVVTSLRRGLRVTTPMRTLLDLGAVVPIYEVRDALERGLAARLYSVAAVEWQLVELARRGRRGCGVLRRVLDERALGDKPPDGLLEPRFAQLRIRFGLPEPVFQYPVPGTDYRIDFAYPDLMLAIEVDGYGTHSSPAALQRDLDRQNTLVALGWTILRFTWADVVRNPSKVAKAIADAIGRVHPGIPG